jgi:hypothetical protein
MELVSHLVQEIKSFSRHSELALISVLDDIATADNRTPDNTANNQPTNCTTQQWQQQGGVVSDGRR